MLFCFPVAALIWYPNYFLTLIAFSDVDVTICYCSKVTQVK